MKTFIYTVIAGALIAASLTSTAIAQQNFVESQLTNDKPMDSSMSQQHGMKMMGQPHMKKMMLHMKDMLASCDTMMQQRSAPDSASNAYKPLRPDGA